MQDDEEVPQPARRHRQVSHIMGYEEDWEEAEGVHMAAKTQPPQAEAAIRRSRQQQQQQDHAEDEELHTLKQRRLAAGSCDDQDAAVPAPASVKRKRVVVLEDDDDGPATDEAADHPSSSQAQRDASADDHDAQAELQSPAARLAEEGLDPVEQLDVPQSRRHSRGQQAGAGSIRDRMHQNQQRIREVRIMHCAWQQSAKKSLLCLLQEAVWRKAERFICVCSKH